MIKLNRRWVALAAVMAGATVFQVVPTGCGPLMGTFGAIAFDVCSVVNCGSGSFFNFCEPVVFFVDCPTAAADQP